MEKEGLAIKAFQVFKEADNGGDCVKLAEEHHKERPEYTTEEYLKAFAELLRVRKNITRNML